MRSLTAVIEAVLLALLFLLFTVPFLVLNGLTAQSTVTTLLTQTAPQK